MGTILNKLLGKDKENLFTSSIWVLFIRASGVLFFFILTLFLTKKFPADIVGKYDFSRSILIVLSSFSILGTNQSILYYSGYLESKGSFSLMKKIYFKMLVIIFSISIFILLLVGLLSSELVVSFFGKEEAYSILLKTALALFFFSITMFNIDAFRSLKHLYISEFFRNIFRYLPFFLGAIVLVVYDKKDLLLDVFLLSFVLTGLLSFIIIVFKLKEQPFRVASKIASIDYRSIIFRSSPMAISSLAFLLMQVVDIILVGKFLDFYQVAFYALAVKLTTVLSIVLSTVNAVNAPILSKLFSDENSEALKNNLKLAARLIFGITVPLILILLLCSETILGFFGENYVNASMALKILLIGQIFNALCGSVGTYMNMTGKQLIMQNIFLVAFVVNLCLNWFLIPKYGIIGAAAATSFSMIIWNISGAYYLWKTERIKTFIH